MTPIPAPPPWGSTTTPTPTSWRPRPCVARLSCSTTSRLGSVTSCAACCASMPPSWRSGTMSAGACVFHGDGIISQFEGYQGLREIDLDELAQNHPGERADWVLEARREDVNAYQVTKQ